MPFFHWPKVSCDEDFIPWETFRTFKNKYLFEYNGTISPFFISFIFVQIFPAKQGRLRSILSCFANVSDLVKQLRDVFCTIFHYYHNYDLEIIDKYLQASCFCIPDAEKERVNTKFFEFNIRPELLFLLYVFEFS